MYTVLSRGLSLCFFLFLVSGFALPLSAASNYPGAVSPTTNVAQGGNLFYLGLILVIILLIFLVVWLTIRLHRANNLASQKNSDILKALADHLNGGMIALIPDEHASLAYANDGFWELLGRPVPDTAETLPDLFDFIAIEDRADFLRMLCAVQSLGQSIATELNLVRADGSLLPVLMRGTLSACESKPLLFCVVIDISEQKELRQRLEAEHKRYEILIEQSDAIIFDTSLETGTVVSSSQFQKVFGRSAQPLQVLKNPILAEQLHPQDREQILKLREEETGQHSPVSTRVRLLKADGEYLWCDLSLYGLYDNGKLTRLMGRIQVVDELVKEHLRLEMLAQIDHMTGVYHKEAFQFLARNSLAEHPGEEFVLFFIDLDNFKQLNDRLGHLQGDEALQHAAQKIGNIFREDDLVGRFGGDEFYVFAHHMPLRAVRQKAAALCRQLQQNFALADGEELTITASVGIARSPSDGLTFRELLEKADHALYSAKSLGKSKFRIYRESLPAKGLSPESKTKST